ncbi:manganese efflux pump MntP, partial [Ferviditalea candida]|nr:manganese efflux pump [Paenibacillaceae bacterium T2]
WLTALLMINLIGIGSNLDNSSIGIAYGAENVRFPHKVNLVVNAVGFVTALIGTYAGVSVSHVISRQIAALCSCIVLCALGCFIVYANYLHPVITRKKKSIHLQTPGIRDGILWGLGLSFTNIVSGFGAAVADIANLWGIILSITVWGYLLIWFGNVVGTGMIARWLGKYSSALSGLLLIAIGVKQIL